MVTPTNVQSVVLPQAVRDYMVSSTNIQSGVVPQALQDDML